MRDVLRSTKYIQVNCDRGCGWTMLVGSLDPRLPDGPFVCDMCVTADIGALQMLGEIMSKNLQPARGSALSRIAYGQGFRRRWYERLPLIGDKLLRRRMKDLMLHPWKAN